MRNSLEPNTISAHLPWIVINCFNKDNIIFVQFYNRPKMYTIYYIKKKSIGDEQHSLLTTGVDADLLSPLEPNLSALALSLSAESACNISI